MLFVASESVMSDWTPNRRTTQTRGTPDGTGRPFGAGSRNRTRDLLITNQLLYQLSYAGMERGV